jgi:hypothetical protein
VPLQSCAPEAPAGAARSVQKSMMALSMGLLQVG